MRWYARIGRKVWLHEIWEFLTAVRFTRNGPRLADFWGALQTGGEVALSARKDVAREERPAHVLIEERPAA
jgi:anaerobic magnesium-protoporphyrin IX monomethyl ester cyclase